MPDTTDETRPADDEQSAQAQPADDIAAADEHQGAIAKRVDALRERLDSVPGGRLALRIVVTIVGSAFVLAGIVMLVIPGPGWLSIFLGLAILGTEFTFARRINDWLRTQVRRVWAWWKARRTRA